jgi:hypothetical protein
MKKAIIITLVLVVCGIGFALITSNFFGNIYRSIIGIEGTSGFDSLVGLPIAYLLFVSLFIPWFSIQARSLYLILLSPALLFTFTIGQDEYFYFPYLFFTIGLAISFLFRKLLSYSSIPD